MPKVPIAKNYRKLSYVGYAARLSDYQSVPEYLFASQRNYAPTITPREGLLESEVLDSSLYGSEKRKLREYAEDNLKLKKFRRENFNEDRTGVAHFDHPKRVYDEFIKEDYVVPSSDE